MILFNQAYLFIYLFIACLLLVCFSFSGFMESIILRFITKKHEEEIKFNF